MKRLIILILVLFYQIPSYSQNQITLEIDSLTELIDKNRKLNNDSIPIWGKNLLSKAENLKDDTLGYDTSRKISYYFLRNREFDSVKKYDDLLMKYASKIDSFKVVSSLQNKAAYYNEIGDKDSAMYVLKLGKKIGYNNLKSKNRQDSVQKIKKILFLQTAIVKNHFRDKDFEKALALTYDNLSTSNKYGITAFHAWNYFYLGLINLELKNYAEAEKYYLKELEYSRKKKNAAMEGFALMHLGNVSFDKGDLEIAKKKYNAADKIFEESNYLKGKLASKKKLFNILEQEKNYQKAIEIGEQYIKDYLDQGTLDDYLSSFYVRIGRAYNNLGQRDIGKDYIDEGIIYASAHPNETNINLISQAYLSYKENESFKKALEFHEMLTRLRDSLLLNDKYTKQLAEANKKFQTEQKEKELTEQKLANQQQQLLTQKANNRNWLLTVGLLGLLISAFFIWRKYKSESRSKAIITKQKTEIEKLQREFHHRLKNDFRSINSFISIVQRQFSDKEIVDGLAELKNRVASMFKVHEILLEDKDITQVKAQPYLIELTQNIEEKYNRKDIKIIVDVDDEETIIADKAIPFGIILNEFVTNSFKYAFDEKGGQINIGFKSDSQNHHLTIKDNGIGLPKDFDLNKLKSLGLSIIPMFTNLHGGSYELLGTDGVTLNLTLPKQVA